MSQAPFVCPSPTAPVIAGGGSKTQVPLFDPTTGTLIARFSSATGWNV
jgi:hypothetical protein